MSGRNSIGTTIYRYGYQGQYSEMDNETGYNSFDLRMYDANDGRWLCPDPFHQFHSPYMAMGNNFINGVDPDGGWFWEGEGTFWQNLRSNLESTFGGNGYIEGKNFWGNPGDHSGIHFGSGPSSLRIAVWENINERGDDGLMNNNRRMAKSYSLTGIKFKDRRNVKFKFKILQGYQVRILLSNNSEVEGDFQHPHTQEQANQVKKILSGRDPNAFGVFDGAYNTVKHTKKSYSVNLNLYRINSIKFIVTPVGPNLHNNPDGGPWRSVFGVLR